MSSKHFFFLFLLIGLLNTNTFTPYTAAFNMDFIEINISKVNIHTGESFLLSGILINNSSAAITDGHITFAISNDSITEDWRPPAVLSYQGMAANGAFLQDVQPNEQMSFSYTLKPLDPGIFYIYVKITTGMGLLKSNKLTISVYGESIEYPESMLPTKSILFIGGTCLLIFSASLGLVLWFKPSLKTDFKKWATHSKSYFILEWHKLKSERSVTISSLICISLIIAAPYILIPIVTTMDSTQMLLNAFSRTYPALVLLGLPILTIIYGYQTKTVIMSFLISFIPMIVKTILVSASRIYPFSPIGAVIYEFFLALFLGCMGLGAAVIEPNKRRLWGYLLLLLGGVMWLVFLLSGILQSFLVISF